MAHALLTQLLATSPLRSAPFRKFYIGATASAMGYTMQATIAAWIMATITPSALMVALVQTASTAPAIFIGLIAGSLADVVDRRKIILAAQIVLLVACGALALTTLHGSIGPATLLVITFIIGAAFTFYMPAQQASLNDFVAREDLGRALALGAASFNIARAVGPALVGGIAVWLGTGPALLAAALFFLPMFVSLRDWGPRERALPGVPERISSGVINGVRYARHSQPLRALFFRTFSFCVCASAFWSLLPVFARDQLGVGAGGYGLLSAAFGAGAVLSAFSLPSLLKRFSLDGTISRGGYLWTVAIGVMAIFDAHWVAIAGAFAAGFAWVSVLAGLSTGLQSAAPAWVRARAIAMNLVIVQTCIAVGSAIWGAVATATETQTALAASAALLMLMQILSRRVPVAMASEADVTTGVLLPELSIAVEPGNDDGPVLVQITYHIEPAQLDEFQRFIRLMEPIRRRNGATSWRVFRDLEQDGNFVERFIISSYAEYMRSRARMTRSDRDFQDRVNRLQSGTVPIRISRFIGVDA